MKYKIIIFHYVGGAGGKFIANCLGMSGKVAFSNFKIAKQFVDTQDFEIIKKALLDTIPPKNKSRTWLDREQGCWQLFGRDIDLIRNSGQLGHELNDLSLLGDQWLPLTSHDKREIDEFLKYFSSHTVKVVLVDGTKEFIDQSIRLKWPSEHNCLDLDIYKKFINELPQIKFDYEIDHWSPIEPNNWSKVNDLAKHLQIDFDMSQADFYTEKYLDFYN